MKLKVQGEIESFWTFTVFSKCIKIHETFVKFPLKLSKMFPLSESLVSNKKEELFFLRNQGGRTGNRCRCNAPNKYVTNL
jgi:hypothetical protein